MLKDFESAKRVPTRNNIASLVRALEGQGLIFTIEPGLRAVAMKVDMPS